MIIEDKSPQKGRKMDKSKIPHAGIVAIILVGFKMSNGKLIGAIFELIKKIGVICHIC